MTDAIRRQEALRFVQMCQEEVDAFAARAQAKLTGGLAACMGTAGPGAVHLLNGLYDAALDQALREDRPTVIDVHVDPGELFMLPRIPVGDTVRFGVAKPKELLGGGSG